MKHNFRLVLISKWLNRRASLTCLEYFVHYRDLHFGLLTRPHCLHNVSSMHYLFSINLEIMLSTAHLWLCMCMNDLLNKTFQVDDMFYNPVCWAASCRAASLIAAQPWGWRKSPEIATRDINGLRDRESYRSEARSWRNTPPCVVGDEQEGRTEEQSLLLRGGGYHL